MKNKLLTFLFMALFIAPSHAAFDAIDLEIELTQFVARYDVCLLDGWIYQDNEIATTAAGETWLCESLEDTFVWHRHTQSY